MSLLNLVMIVKNGNPLLKNTLMAIKPYIDYWTILDTGSTDGSQECVREVLGKVQGNLYEEPFIDFSKSRNRAFELAGKRCKYNIMIDDSYVIHGGDILREILAVSDEKAFSIMIQDENKSYDSIRITKSSANLRYKYKVHEDIDYKKPSSDLLKTVIYLEDTVDFVHTRRSNDRYPRDLKILLEEYKIKPKDSRIIFYIAQTYFQMGDLQKASTYYKKRISICGSGVCDTIPELYYSLYMLGHIYNTLNDWEKAESFYMKAYNLRPYRSEPIYHIAKYYFTKSNFDKAEKFLIELIKLDTPPQDIDTFLIETRIYKYDIPYLLIEIYFRKGDSASKKIAMTLVKKLLINFPEDSNLKNMLYACQDIAKTVKKYNKPCFVIHTGVFKNNWSPSKYNGISGSEIMAINLAKMFVSKFRVFVFAKCDGLEGIYDNVEYLDVSKYDDFINKTYVNYLIVLRFPQYLRYHDNIENVYFWLHDILPFDNSFQTHKTKFKQIICLSEWHKNFFYNEYKFPKERISIIGNMIDINRFAGTIKKVAYRFIYSSSSDRGFRHLVKMFPIIHAKYPSAELYAFLENGNSFINSIDTDYIKIHQRVSQHELAIEMMKSDIWLYPTDFNETYCITALEAQAAKCLCVCTNKASLNTIVGDRGIMIDGDVSKDSVQTKMLEELFKVMEDVERKKKLIESGYEWAQKQDFNCIMEMWNDLLKN